MPIAPIDNKGAYVYYEDSGVHSGIQDYTTVVFVHGYSFNGGASPNVNVLAQQSVSCCLIATFLRLFTHAPTYGLRIFTMNMRDYRGSSTYAAEELAAMVGPDTTLHAEAVRQFGRDVVGFLMYVCTAQGVPALAVDGDRKTGGIALVTWSMGNMAPLAILGDPGTLDATSTAILSRYLRKVILYGMPLLASSCARATQAKFRQTVPA